MPIALRDLYRTLELPGANRLRDAHAALDRAVGEAYRYGLPREFRDLDRCPSSRSTSGAPRPNARSGPSPDRAFRRSAAETNGSGRTIACE